jgi:AAA+ ATPase superfamily predicted ATPase
MGSRRVGKTVMLFHCIGNKSSKYSYKTFYLLATNSFALTLVFSLVFMASLILLRPFYIAIVRRLTN